MATKRPSRSTSRHTSRAADVADDRLSLHFGWPIMFYLPPPGHEGTSIVNIAEFRKRPVSIDDGYFTYIVDSMVDRAWLKD